ncbi:LLM class flavin-dependent oxidoreductase [Streptomyces sp. NPDC005820]|uniref:LLM class flavin-dependent oxidoreductase n=1 Tax=Streptomyces sp. NPDC005820 TaxID=3157069 RepID=UPI0033E4A095
MRISIVEQATVPAGRTAFDAFEEVLTTARHAEAHGFHRMWLAEHHAVDSVASHAPEVLMGVVARETERLRIGSGAILLNHYSSLKVAELFLQLEVLAPGRFDMGLGRATAGPVVDAALRRDRGAHPTDDFAEQVQEVLAFLHRQFPDRHPFSQIRMMPTVTARPDPWLLGSSGSSAELAGTLGLGYSFAGFINPNGAVRALRNYRRTFVPTLFGPETPQAMLGVTVFAADTDEEALRMTWPQRAIFANLGRTGTSVVVPSIDDAARMLTRSQREEPARIVDGRYPAQVAGRPETVRDQLLQMVEETGATELIVQSISPDQEARRHSHALVAEALGVRPQTSVPALSTGGAA